MNIKHVDNPPAFLITYIDKSVPGVHKTVYVEGILTRDYFVAAALTGIVNNIQLLNTCVDFAADTSATPEKVIAIRAYKMADALLTARTTPSNVEDGK